MCAEAGQQAHGGAWLFTELSQPFVFVWGHVIERRFSDNWFSFPPFCSPHPSLRSAAVSVQRGLLSVQNVRSSTDSYPFWQAHITKCCRVYAWRSAPQTALLTWRGVDQTKSSASNLFSTPRSVYILSDLQPSPVTVVCGSGLQFLSFM